MSRDSDLTISDLVGCLKQGEVVAYPTEAVFGLGCDPDNLKAIEQLLVLKNRPWQKGLILIASDYKQLANYIDDSKLTLQQKETILSSWPGAITWVLPVKTGVSHLLCGEFNSLAVRVSAHPDVRALCQAFGKPIVSTSANLSGMPPCKNAIDVKQQFGQAFPVLNRAVGGRENPSEIRDALTGKLLRQG